MSDSVSEIDIDGRQGRRGRSPCAGATLRVLGGDAQRPGPPRARRSTSPTAATTPWPRSTSPPGKVRGFRHAGYFPTAVALGRDGKTAFVLNTKGNGSVSKTTARQAGQRPRLPGDRHRRRPDGRPRRARPSVVARNNRWDADPGRPAAEGLQRRDQARPLHHQGEPDLRRGLRRPARGQRRPQALQPGRDGHAQPPQDRPRVHPVRQRLRQRDQQRRRPRLVDPVPGQRLPRALLRRLLADLPRRRRRRHGDLRPAARSGTPRSRRARRSASGASSATTSSPRIEPEPKDWFEVWEDRSQGDAPVQVHRRHRRRQPQAATSTARYHYWPLLQSDQYRADVFIREYEEFSRRGRGPRPDDHEPPLRPRRGDQPQVPDAPRHDGRQRPGAGPGRRGGLEEPAVEGDLHLRRRGRRPVGPRPRRRPPDGLHGDQPVQPRGRPSTRRSTPRPT